jgi:hypothetical protein
LNNRIFYFGSKTFHIYFIILSPPKEGSIEELYCYIYALKLPVQKKFIFNLPFGRAGWGFYLINPTPAVVLVAASIKIKAPFDLLSLSIKINCFA